MINYPHCHLGPLSVAVWKLRGPSSEARSENAIHTVPYGTGPGLGVFLVINCQATIIRSLRDENPLISPTKKALTQALV